MFGDGAGAAVVKAKEGRAYLPAMHSDEDRGAALTCDSMYYNRPAENPLMKIDGQAVFNRIKEVP